MELCVSYLTGLVHCLPTPSFAYLDPKAIPPISHFLARAHSLTLQHCPAHAVLMLLSFFIPQSDLPSNSVHLWPLPCAHTHTFPHRDVLKRSPVSTTDCILTNCAMIPSTPNRCTFPHAVFRNALVLHQQFQAHTHSFFMTIPAVHRGRYNPSPQHVHSSALAIINCVLCVCVFFSLHSLRYQSVSYDINSRSGNETEFVEMVETCRKAGVGVIVDMVFNQVSIEW